MDETRSARLDAIEAWMAGARVRVDGLNAEVDAGAESLGFDERLHALRAEAEAQMRELEELSGWRLGRAHRRRAGARWSRRT